jgi:PAS domain S-box-containing protein
MKLDPKKGPRPSGAKPAASSARAKSRQNWQQHAPLFLETLLNLITPGVGIVDAAGVVRYANPGCRNIYGLEPEEIVGRHFHQLYADLQSLNRMLAELRQHGRVDHWHTEARRGEGQAVPVEITLVRLQGARAQPLGSVALIYDARQPRDLVDQLQQREMDLIRLNRNLELANLELARANRMKSEFLANTSHELRTPLNSILGFLRLILEGMCDDPAEERLFLQNAYDSARSLLDLINELLDSAKIEAGKMELQLTEVDVGKIFCEVEKLTRLQADQKGVQLTFRQPRVPILVRADPGKLQQILLNLVTNALKFTPKGEVRVQARSLAAKGHVLFQVRDTGIGIRPEIQNTLFQKFVQGDGSSTRKYAGTGLGLAICRNLVEFMGGQIWLSSDGPGKGTTASFTLPLISPKRLYWRRLDDRERGFQIQGPAQGRLILLVEDEPRILDIMGRILQKHGYRTAFAVTADDGLEGARRLRPDLITIDMGLPVRPGGTLHSGMDLYYTLQDDAFTMGIPVILVTGHDASLSQAPQALPPLLTKPFRAQELVARVAGQLDRDGD